MTTITLEGKEYQLDIEQAKKLNLLKEKDNRVKSWKEFELKYSKRTGYYWSTLHNNLVENVVPIFTNEQLTPHEAEAISAFSRLLKLRRDWIGEWEPDWEYGSTCKYGVSWYGSKLLILEWNNTSCALSFPTLQMAQEFLETFRDLIEEAKILI